MGRSSARWRPVGLVSTGPLLILAVLAPLAVLVTACGPVDEADEDPVVLRVLMADDWATRPPILDAVRRFEAANADVRVDIVGRPFGQIMDELESSVALDRPHDVVQGHAFAAGARQLAEPIDDWWAERDDGDWYPGAIEDVTWGASRYGVPLDINALFLVTNDRLVDRPPDDFGELRALATRLAEQGIPALTIPADNWQTYGWFRANGGEIVEVADDGTPTFTLDQPQNVEALQVLVDLVMTDAAIGPESQDVPPDAFSLFASEQTAMLVTGTWDTALLASDHPGVPLQTAPMPGGADGTTSGSVLGGSSVFVGRGTEHMDLALDFIEAITADDVAIAMAELDGRLPPKPALFAEAGLDQPVYDGVTEQLATAHPQRLIAFPHAQTAFEIAVDDALTGRASAEEALGSAQRVALASARLTGRPGAVGSGD